MFFPAQELAEVTLLWVAPGCRVGPWQARKWTVCAENGVPKREVISAEGFIFTVTLTNDALTQDSLDNLQLHGVPAGVQPRRDASLPQRTV